MFNQWIQWRPLSNLAQHYHLEFFIVGINKFEIFLAPSRQEEKKVLIVFEENALAYRHSKRALRTKTLKIVEHQQGKEFLNWPFFKVINSTYLQFLSKRSCEIYMPGDFVHFIFLTQNDVLEVVDTTGVGPRVEFTNIDLP